MTLLSAIAPCRLFAFAVALCVPVANVAIAYTPFDPEIEKMVEGGLRYLEANLNAKTGYDFGPAIGGGTGEKVLAGYAHLKAAHDPNNPVVKKGIESAITIVRGLAGGDSGDHTNSKSVYNAGIAAMLLAEADKTAYRKELETLARFFRIAQFRGGGFGYNKDHLGDVSQTQYAMLGLWTLNNAGVEIDFGIIPKTSNWLNRVQDPSGGWPYQGVDPGASGKLVSQTRVSASMALAGGSANLIAGDILGLWGDALSQNNPQIDGLPKAIKLANDRKKEANVTIPHEPVLASIVRCQQYLATNSSDPGKLRSVWPYYQLYTLERYESFREVAFGLEKDPSPAWYNDGVEFLKKRENPQGGFDKEVEVTPSVSTAFAILFLIRSTQKAIAAVSRGSLAGGYGLPSDTTKITVNGTQIKGEPVATSVEDLLSLLEADDPKAADSSSIPEDLKLQADPAARRAQIDRLERLVRGSQSWQARRVAARLLGQSDELRVVPALIFALSDPDSKVKQYADDGLCFISRKFDGVGFPAKPNSDEIRLAQRLWREWFLSVMPGYIFTDAQL